MKKLAITLEDGSAMVVSLTEERLRQVKEYLQSNPQASMGEAVRMTGKKKE